ncbi:hypothetical protein ACFL0T_01885 [Candidatus Omnitrophota bacterium]
MNIKTIAVVVIIILVYFYFKAPSADSIVEAMNVNRLKGTIEYKGVTYTAKWSSLRTHKGEIRYIGRAYDKSAPYITNDAIVTTGDFSDPSKVNVTPIRNGNMSWSAPEKPTGTLIVLHFIPANKAVYDDLKQLESGQNVKFIGREEVDSKITGSDKSFIGLGHDNHKFFLLEKVR